MYSKPAIRATQLSKCYHLYAQPIDRLKQFLRPAKGPYFREFWALQDVSFEIMPGEVLGIVGRNGAGKSTLLQLLCGTLTPTSGHVEIQGRVAALLELGSGFNPEFSGRENVFMNAAILGLSQDEIADRFDDIVAFSGIGDFIDQPVKTYSSGMFVRLAFSVAINTDPDILVIDEALSVGDSIFARKSFERIMALKEAGKTILFCSHAVYQIEALCNKALWIEKGQLQILGSPDQVIVQYNEFLNAIEQATESNLNVLTSNSDAIPVPIEIASGIPKIIAIQTYSDKTCDRQLNLISCQSDLTVEVSFTAPVDIPVSSVGVVINGLGGTPLLSAGSVNDGFELKSSPVSPITLELCFPKIALLKGIYSIDVFLMCDQGIHVYEHVRNVAELQVEQSGLEIGVVTLPHEWRSKNAKTI